MRPLDWVKPIKPIKLTNRFSKDPGKLGRRKVKGKIGLRYCQFNVTLVSIAAKKSKVPRKLRGKM